MQLRRARYRNDPRLLDLQPPDCDLRGRYLFPGGDLAEQIDQGLVRLASLRREAGNDVAEVGAVEPRVLVDRAREEALAQRAEGNEADAEFLKRRQDLLLGFAPPQRVFALDRGDRLDGVRPPHRLHARLGKSEVLDLAFADQVLDRAGDIFDRHARVNAMLIEQIDDARLQSLERRFGHLFDVIGTAVEAPLLAVFRVDIEAELGCDHHLIANGSQSLAYEFLIRERAIDFGGVEEGNPTFECRPDERNSLLLVDRGTVAVAQSHAAQPDGRNLQSTVSERALLHVASTKIQNDSCMIRASTPSINMYNTNGVMTKYQ